MEITIRRWPKRSSAFGLIVSLAILLVTYAQFEVFGFCKFLPFPVWGEALLAVAHGRIFPDGTGNPLVFAANLDP